MSADALWTVRRLLEWTTPFFTRKEVDSPRLSAELLLAHVLQVPRLKLYTDYERPVTDHQLTTYRDLVKRGAEHEPIAYLTGKAHFFNLEFDVTRDVLIPRPETETLVEHVLQLARNVPGFESPRILDLCTGSGCIAAAIAHHLKTASVLATDLSEKALAIAKTNIEKLNLSDRISFTQGDLFDALKRDVDRAPFHLILANPPYIPTSQLATLDKNVKDFEPHSALDGGLDGLAIHRRILNEAPTHLLPNGRIYLEIAFDQGPAIQQLASTHPSFTEVKILKDPANHDRLLTALKP
jgi:release factor glutamine methyltransferase